jgi:PAS domain S-box-containing protein
MVPGWVLLLVSLAYVALLFGVAYFGDRRPLYPSRAWLRPIVYSLALAVYCSSWTFYGAVGSATRDGLSYLPIYLGPILLFLVFVSFFERLVLIAKEQNITSIADFIASRYGKYQPLAVAVTVIAIVAAIPYIALQFKAVAMSIEVLSGSTGVAAAEYWFTDSAFYVALLLAVFSILFGTREISATEHHHGMMLAIALESLVKLVAFVAVGVFAIWVLGGLPEVRPLPRVEGPDARGLLPAGFLAQTVLAFAAIFCLPRQFQVGVVECEDPQDVRRARWLFPAYLIIISVLVVPIAVAGLTLAAGQSVHPDSFVLWLPLRFGHNELALFAYIGGFSAATGMVIVASVALATMISNDLVMPALLRIRRLKLDQRQDISSIVLAVRRISILLMALLAFLYYRSSTEGQYLANLGLLAFVAVAQFAPAIIGGMYWRGASKAGAMGGLVAGFLVCAYTLLVPSLAGSGYLPMAIVTEGPWGMTWLKPQALFHLEGWDPITHGTFWSLLINIAFFVFLSLRYRPSVEERLRALPFLEPHALRPAAAAAALPGRASVGDLWSLAERIVGERGAARAFTEYAETQAKPLNRSDPANRALFQHTERLIAGAIGATSARRMLTSALRGTGMEIGEVVSLLDETSQELRFNRELLAATMENISQGISVVDADLHLVAWNRRYLELFDYPAGMVYVGRPVEDLIRYNAERGECGPGDVEEHVRKRVEYMRRGSPHVFERVRPDGTVIEMRGRPMPGGGFVTTFTDVTDYKRVERELREINETLELRVAERTAELSLALEAQRSAKQEAEAANLSKTRFLAAASHDLLQPMNAARLFVSALRAQEIGDPEVAKLVARVDNSLRAAEELLDGLLDISRLDSGAMRPEWSSFRVDELLEALREQFAPLAASRGLEFRVLRCGASVRSDRRLLRRILQNFLANALRYTRRGRVLLGVRRRPGSIEFQVCDTGPGIPADQRPVIFEEFHRGDSPSPWGEKGLGLGLSICDRIARMLDHALDFRSTPGRGSLFSVRVPLAAAPAPPRSIRLTAQPPGLPAGMHVLCLDNDRSILEGMAELLGRWGVCVDMAERVDEALALARARRHDVLLVDFHLHDRMDGLEAMAALRALHQPPPPGALITADTSDALTRNCRALGYAILRKPVRPAALRALIGALHRHSVADRAVTGEA